MCNEHSRRSLWLLAWDTQSAHRKGHDPCRGLGEMGSGMLGSRCQQTGNQALRHGVGGAEGLPPLGSPGKAHHPTSLSQDTAGCSSPSNTGIQQRTHLSWEISNSREGSIAKCKEPRFCRQMTPNENSGPVHHYPTPHKLLKPSELHLFQM